MNSSPVLVKVTVRFRTGAMVLLRVKVALPPSVILVGATAMDNSGTSLSSIMPASDRVRPPPCRSALIALERVKVSTSSTSSKLSSLTGTWIIMLVSPGTKLRVPLVAV